MSSILVRQAILSDLEAVIPLFDSYRQFYGRSGDMDAARQFLRGRFDHGESTIFLAHLDTIPVGFTQLYPSFSSISLARIFVLNDLFVAEQARKKGVATRLISAALAHARTLGAARVSLSTATINTPAQALYQSTGWKRDDQFYVYNFAITK